MVARTDGPFAYWKVTGDAVRDAAEAPGTHAGAIQSLAGELEGDEKRVAGSIEGDIEAGVAANPAAAKKVAHSLAVKGQYAVGLLKSFGDLVDEFDRTVNQINVDYNTRYRSMIFTLQHQPEYRSGEEKIDHKAIGAGIQADLQGRYHQAQVAIDDAADGIATKFGQGPTDANVLELIRAGLIPLSAATLFPGLKITDADKVAYYKNAVAKGELPDFATMSEDEVKQYLVDNPQVSEDIVAIMTASTLPPALTKLVTVQAKVDAELLNDALEDKDPSSATLAQIDKANERLAAINAGIADSNGDGKPDHLMTAAQASYIENWTNTVGADNLAKLPSVVHEAVSSTAPGAPSYAIDAMVSSRLSPVADAILNYTNPEVQEKGAVPLGVCTQDNPSGQPYPQAIRELLDMRIGEQEDGYRVGDANGDDNGTFTSIKNLDAFNGWADLLSNASDGVEGGEQFSTDLAHQAIEAKQDINAILGSAGGLTHRAASTGDWSEYGGLASPDDLDALKTALWDGGASDLLSIASRNEDASSHLLLDDDDRKAVLGLNWDDGAGAGDLVRSATDRDPGANGDGATTGGGSKLQAEAALAVMKEISKDPSEYTSIMNESVSDAVVDTGIAWVDTFGDDGTTEGASTDAKDVLGRPLDLKVAMTSEDQAQFLRFIAGTGESGDDTDPVRFQASVRAYGNDLITTAAASDDPDAHAKLRSALEWAGKADGRVYASNIDWATDHYEGENEKKEAEIVAHNRSLASAKAAANFLTGVATTGASAAFPPASPFISIAGSATGPMWDKVFADETVPDFEHMNAEERARALQEGEENAEFDRPYRLAALTDPSHRAEYPELFTKDGSLKSLHEIKKEDNTEMLSRLSDTFMGDFNNTHPSADPTSVDDTYVHKFDLFIGGGAVDADREDKDGWRSETNVLPWLYGDNKKSWDDSDDHVKYNMPGDDRNPYQPDRDHVDDDYFHPAK